MKYRGVFASSSDLSGQTLSATVQGIVVVLSAVVPMFAMQFFHITVTAGDISSLVTEVGTVIGVILTIRGLLLKIINATSTVPTVVPPATPAA